jgi:hypothetical protein
MAYLRAREWSFDRATARVHHVYSDPRSFILSDTTPPPVSNDPANDGYEIENADEARRDAGRDFDDEVREADRDLGDKAHSTAKRVKDAIEDVVPGDSDKDGH